MAGQPGRYLALGVSTGTRGAYASYPIHDARGKIIGAAVVKLDVEGMDEQLAGFPYAFLIDPGGVVFLSGTKNLLFKTLWPMPAALRQEKRASQQFGDAPLDPLFRTEPINSAFLRHQDQSFLVSRQAIGADGWSLVLLQPTKAMMPERLVGIGITLLLAILVLTFFVVTQIGSHRTGELDAALQDAEVTTRALRKNENRLARINLELQEMSAQVRRDADRWHDFSQCSNDWFWEVDAQLRFCYFSDNFEDFYGVPPEQILGRTRKELLEANGLLSPQALQAHLAQLEARLPFRNFEYQSGHDANVPHWFSVSGTPYWDAQGAFAGYRGTGSIITERKRLERDLLDYQSDLNGTTLRQKSCRSAG